MIRTGGERNALPPVFCWHLVTANVPTAKICFDSLYPQSVFSQSDLPEPFFSFVT
jgi:hypothetical protein